MSFRSLLVNTACSAMLLVPATLLAQSPTKSSSVQPPVTSERRIKVQKDVRGESHGTLVESKATMRADSIANAERMVRDSIDRAAQRERDSIANLATMRKDSIDRVERARTDSIAAAEAAMRAAMESARRDSVARADSIAAADQFRMQQARNRFLFNGTGWYVGVGGGGSKPNGDLSDLGYKSGYNLSVPIGWHGNTFLGARLDLGYTQFSGNQFIGRGPSGLPVTLTNTTPKVFSAVGNLTARAPLNASKSLKVYALAGAGLYNFRDFGAASALSGFLGNDVLLKDESLAKKTRTKIGAQAGAGFELGNGPAQLFVETRFVNVFADRNDSVQFTDFFGANRSKNVRWVPIMIGVNIH